jgi:hypothetical protein
LTCRVYQTEAGTLAGIPGVTDLTAALRKKIAQSGILSQPQT